MDDTDHLLPSDHLRNRAVMGRVSMVHRGAECAAVGDTFEAYGSTFEVTDLTETTVGDLEVHDARQEARSGLEPILTRVQNDAGEAIDDDTTVFRYHFARRPSMG